MKKATDLMKKAKRTVRNNAQSKINMSISNLDPIFEKKLILALILNQFQTRKNRD